MGRKFTFADKVKYHTERDKGNVKCSSRQSIYSYGFLCGIEYAEGKSKKADIEFLNGRLDGAREKRVSDRDDICFQSGLIAGTKARLNLLRKNGNSAKAKVTAGCKKNKN